jgi:signal transduction histidine kinase
MLETYTATGSPGARTAAPAAVRSFVDCCQSIGAEAGWHEALLQILEQARRVLEADAAAIGVLGLSKQGGVRALATGETSDGVPLVPLLANLASREDACCVDDLAAHELAGKAPRWAAGHGSVLGVPLRTRDETLGSICVARNPGPRPFDEEDQTFLELLATSAAREVALARQSTTLAHRSAFFEAMVEQTPDPMLFFEQPRVLKYANPPAQRTFVSQMGHIPTGERFPDQYLPLTVDGRPLSHEELPHARALRGERVDNLKLRMFLSGGRSSVPTMTSARPVRSEAGEITGAVVTYRDIAAEEELEGLRAELAAMIVHDLRTPLGALVLSVEHLLSQSTGGRVEAPVPVLQRILRTGRRLDRQITELLDASRVELGHWSLTPIEVELDPFLAETVADLRPTMGDHPVELAAGSARTRVLVDPLRLTQILTNLLSNAARYSRPGGRVYVRSEVAEGGAIVSVQDEGPGISAEDMSHLFDRYFRSRETRGTHGEGLGLGLYITKGLVEASGGRIWVESAPGHGARFRVWLPDAPPDKRQQRANVGS